MTLIKRKKNPVFYYNNKTSKEIKAGGVLFYYYNKNENKLKFLMINNKGKYEDFGGRTEDIDKSIEYTVSREVEEESNKIFLRNDVLNIISSNFPLYIKHSKYVLYICEIDKNYDTTIFGSKEFHDNIYRTVEWIDYEDLINSSFINKMNHRLRFRRFFKYIKNIKNNKFNKE